jgi:hypothetical protein
LGAGFAFAVDKEITLGWNHDGADLSGFKLHYGTVAGTYSASVDAVMGTKCSDLGIGPEEFCHKFTVPVPANVVTTFYFVASAYDAETPPNESGFSEEVSTVYDFEVPPIVTDLGAVFDKSTNILTFSWTYETVWLPKIEKWILSTSDVAGGPYTKVVDVPYDPLTSPPYTTEVEIPVPSTEMVKYYVLTAHRGVDNNNAASANSNEVKVIIDKMPPKSPFELKIKIR